MARQTDDRWQGRPGLALLIRTAIFVIPIVCSVGASIMLSRYWRLPAGSEWWKFAGWWISITVVATGVLWSVDSVARRFLPLATLYRMSLIFPDKAPSRYAVARKSGSVRQLQDELEAIRTTGFRDDNTRAAETILRLVAGLSRHDKTTRGHSERVRVFTDMIADELDIPDGDRNKLRWAALLHDVGKLTVHADILNKPGKPTEEEWIALKSHPEAGARIAAPLADWLGEWGTAIVGHHEKYDGTGYPYGQTGKEIPWPARIVAVCDAYDTMTAARAYKKPMSAAAAREELAACAGGHFDPVVVRAFLNISLGRLRLAMGPLSWLAQSPALAGAVNNVGTIATVGTAAAATSVAVATGAIITPTLEPAPPPPPPVVVESPTPEPTPPLPSPEPSPEPTPEPSPEPSPSPTPDPLPSPAPIAPALSSGFSSSPGPGSSVRPGDKITVTVTVGNVAGASEAVTGVTVKAPTFGGLSPVPGSTLVNGSPVPGDLTVGIPVGDVAPGSTTTIVYEVVVPPDAADGAVLVPTLEVVGTNGGTVVTAPGGYVVNAATAVTATVGASPSTSTPVIPGSTITYTVVVANAATAGVSATGVTFSLPALTNATIQPGSATIDGAPAGASPAAGIALGDLAPGTSRTVTFAVTVASPLPDGSSVSATTRVSGGGIPAPITQTLTSTVDASAVGTVSLLASPAAGSFVVPGDTVTYTAVVGNAPGATERMSNVTLALPLPSGTTLGSVTVDGAPATDPASLATGLRLPDLAPGASSTVVVTATVTRPQPDGTVLTVVGVANADQLDAPTSASLSHVVSASPILTVAGRAVPAEGAAVTPGNTIAYTYTVTNDATATATATGIVFTATQDPNVTYVAGSSRIGAAPVADASNPFVDGEALPSLPPGSSTTVQFQVRVNKPLPNGTKLATKGSITADQLVASLDRTITHTVASAPVATLSKTRAPAGPITPGSVLTYTIVVGNDPSATASLTGVTLTDPTPANTTYVAGSATDNGTPIAGATNPFASGRSLGTISPGQARTITFRARVNTPLPNGTTITNTATVTATNLSGPVSANAVGTVASSPTLSVVKTATPVAGSTVTPGSTTIRYTIDVTNSAAATATATNVVLADATPAGTTETGTATLDGAPVGAGNPFAGGLNIGTLTPGTTKRAVFDATVNIPQPDGTIISNSASTTADQVAVPVSSGAVTHTVGSSPILTQAVSAVPVNGSSVTPGQLISFTIVIDNDPSATETATGVAFTSPTPTNSTFVPGSAVVDGTPLADLANPFAGGYALSDLPPGSSHTLSYQALVNLPLPNGSTVDGTFGTVADQVVGSLNTATSHPVSSSTALTLTVAPAPAEAVLVTPGTPIRYVMTVANGAAATETATSVTITDPTPANTTASESVDETATATPGVNLFGPLPYALPDLPPGASATVELEVDVDNPLPDGTIITNSTTLDALQLAVPLNQLTNHTVSSVTLLTSTTTSVPVDGAAVGQTNEIEFTTVISNDPSATQSATGITFQHPDATNSTYVASSATLNGVPFGAPTPNPWGLVPVPLPDLAPGASHTIVHRVAVDLTALTGDPIDSTATTDADQLGAPIVNTTSHTVAGPTLLIDQSNTLPVPSGPVVPGTVIDYRITVTNDAASPSQVTNLAFTDVTPTNTTYVDGSATVDAVALGPGPNPFASGYAYGSLAVGATATFEFQVVVDSPQVNGTVITNTVDVDVDQLPTTTTDTITHTVASAPDLQMTLTPTPVDAASVTPGDRIDYDVTIANTAAGTELATGVVFTLDTPADTTVIESEDETATVAPGVNLFAGPGGYALPDLAPGDSVTLRLSVNVDTPLPNGTVISALHQLDADQLGAPITQTIAHTVASSTDLQLTLTPTPADGATVLPDDVISYAITVTNTAAATATATSVTIVLDTPNDVGVVESEDETTAVTPGTNIFAGPGGHTLSVNLLPGDTANLRLEVQVDNPVADGTVITATANVSSAEGPGTGDTVSHTVSLPPLFTVTKTAQWDADNDGAGFVALSDGAQVTPGGRIRYQVVVENVSGFTINFPSHTDPTPAGTTYVLNSSTYDPDGPIGPSPLSPIADDGAGPDANPHDPGGVFGPIANGQQRTFGFDVVVDSPQVDGTPITNVSTVNHFAGSETGSITHTVSSAPDLDLVLTATPAAGSVVTAGSTITYTIELTHLVTGTEIATNVLVDHPTPPNTTYTLGTATLDPDGPGPAVPSAVPDSGTGDNNPFFADYNVGDLAPGDAVFLTFDVTVNGGLPPDTTITKIGRATPDRTAFEVTQSIQHVTPGLPPTVVISEFRLEGPAGATDDFIELHNPTSTPVDISNWQVTGDNDAGSPQSTITINAGTTIPAFGYFLLGGPNYDPLQHGGVTPDQSYGPASDPSQYGGWELRTDVGSGSVLVDQAGVNGRPPAIVGSNFTEGTPLGAITGVLSETSYERRHEDGRGNCIDTDDNAADFVLNWAPGSVNPQNLSSPAVPCGSPPPAPAATASGIVVSEVRGDGPARDGVTGSGADEFIELFNAGATTVDLSNWTVSSAAGLIFAFDGPTPVLLGPGEHFLLARNDGGIDAYSGDLRGGALPDAEYGSAPTPSLYGSVGPETFVNNGAVIVRDAGSTIIDQVDLGGAPPILPAYSGRGISSYERRGGGTLGSCVDTDVDIDDWQYRMVEDPQNWNGGAGSPPTPCPTAVTTTWTTLYAKSREQGSSSAQVVEPLSPQAPTMTTLPNYSEDRDGDPGRRIDRSAPPSEPKVNPQVQASFQLANRYATTVSGPVTFDAWISVKGGSNDKAGAVNALLMDCPLGSASTPACTVIAGPVTVSRDPWDAVNDVFVPTTFDFGVVSHTIAEGFGLTVKLTVPEPPSEDDMDIAYDVDVYPTRLNGSFSFVRPGPTTPLYLYPTGKVTKNGDVSLFEWLDPTAPTEVAGADPAAVSDWDEDVNAGAGRGLNKLSGSTSLFDETDPKRVAQYAVPSGSGITIGGDVTFTFWSAVKDFATAKPGGVEAILLDCSGDLASCTQFASASSFEADWSLGVADWSERVLTFSGVSRSIAADRFLVLKVGVDPASSQDLWFAYAYVEYPSRLDFASVTFLSVAPSSGIDLLPSLPGLPRGFDYALLVAGLGWSLLRLRRDRAAVAAASTGSGRRSWVARRRPLRG